MPSRERSDNFATTGSVRHDGLDYVDYVNDTHFVEQYREYQAKYADNPKECDKKTAQIVNDVLTGMGSDKNRVLDIGCSTGNFLLLLKRLNVKAELFGGDLMDSHIEECRNNPALSGVHFEKMDMFDIAPAYDVIVANAVTYLFDQDQYERACASICKALKPGGYFIGYEFVNQGEASYTVVEPSAWHPDGLTLHMRSEQTVTETLKKSGFDDVAIEWFNIPIDLPKPAPGSIEEATMTTYTIREEGVGRRLMFRGNLYQPWAHIISRKG